MKPDYRARLLGSGLRLVPLAILVAPTAPANVVFKSSGGGVTDYAADNRDKFFSVDGGVTEIAERIGNTRFPGEAFSPVFPAPNLWPLRLCFLASLR